MPIYELFLGLPELKKAVGRSTDQKNNTEKIPDDIDEDYNDNSYNYLKSLVDLVEVEYESRVGGVKEMINNVSSK